MRKKSSLTKLLAGIKWPKNLIVISILLTSVGSMFNLIIPLLTGRMVDNAVNSDIDMSFIMIFIMIFIISTILSGISAYLLSKLGEKIIYAIRDKLWKHIMYLRMSFFDDNETGQIMSRVTEDTIVINSFISQNLPSIFPSFISLIGSIIILLLLDWEITILSLIIIPIFCIIMIPLGKYIQKVSINTQTEIANFNGLLGRVLSEMTLVKSSLSEEVEINKSRDNLSKIYSLGLKQARIFAIIQPISGMLILATIAILLGVGGYRVSTGEITSGVLVSMIFYIIQLATPLTNLSTVITDYQKAVGASSRIGYILEEKGEDMYTGVDILPNTGELSFENVSFKYDNSKILKDISFKIPNNSITAIVGPSGSGKTTIFNLLQRLYNIDTGQILYNGINIADFSLYEWRKKIGYVMQDNPMMNGTIKENLLYGLENESISMDKIKHYAELSNSYDFISKFDDGFDTLVGESGTKLSGGQRQRIDITRNFIREPDILLLDEITSNLDSNSEQKIQEALNEFSLNRTLIIIAHRLSTIKKADNIIFIDNGEVTGIGDHQTLMVKHSKYRDFVDSQMLSETIK